MTSYYPCDPFVSRAVPEKASPEEMARRRKMLDEALERTDRIIREAGIILPGDKEKART